MKCGAADALMQTTPRARRVPKMNLSSAAAYSKTALDALVDVPASWVLRVGNGDGVITATFSDWKAAIAAILEGDDDTWLLGRAARSTLGPRSFGCNRVRSTTVCFGKTFCCC